MADSHTKINFTCEILQWFTTYIQWYICFYECSFDCLVVRLYSVKIQDIFGSKNGSVRFLQHCTRYAPALQRRRQLRMAETVLMNIFYSRLQERISGRIGGQEKSFCYGEDIGE